jgi:DnaJ-class molecular chaperone
MNDDDSEYEVCNECGGTGANPDEYDFDCEHCSGLGRVWLGTVLQC